MHTHTMNILGDSNYIFDRVFDHEHCQSITNYAHFALQKYFLACMQCFAAENAGET